MKQAIVWGSIVIALCAIFISILSFQVAEREYDKFQIMKLEYEKKLLELENKTLIDLYEMGYEPYICEDKRCWIKKEL